MITEATLAPGFERVKAVFAETLIQTPNAGSAFCVYVNGQRVVDLAGGVLRHGAPFTADTPVPVFSATKGISAMSLLLLSERGLLDLAAPVAEYWPEFAAAGKEAVTVRDVLAHRAGVPAYDRVLTRPEVLDGRSAPEALAAQPPYWEPGSAHGYHAVTYGFLISELVRRVDGRRTVGQYVAHELAKGQDLWIGLPAEQRARVAQVQPGAVPPSAKLLAELGRFAPDRLPGRALTLDGVLPVAGRGFAYNDIDVLTAELAASNAVCTARALAHLYSAAVTETGGRRLLGPETVRLATTTVSAGPDLVLGRETRFGLGFMLPTDDQPFLGPDSFGHPGAGGSLGMADPALGVGLAFTTTGLGAHVLADPRALALVAATRSCLDL